MGLEDNELSACFQTIDGATDTPNDGTSGFGGCIGVSGTFLNDNEFHHVAVTRKAGDKIEYYIDGAPVKTVPITNTSAITIQNDVFIGNANTAPGQNLQNFSGIIDEAGLFNRALSAEEIQAIYDAGSAGLCKDEQGPTTVPGLIHLWSGEGNADDLVGNANGTLGGTTGFDNGLCGQAFSFDGQQSSIINPLPVNINPSVLPQMTMGMMVNLRSVANGNSLGWVIGHDNGGFDRSLALTDSRYSYGVAGGTGVSPHSSSLVKLKDNLDSWHYIAVSYDASTQTAIFYADGVTQQVFANPGVGLVNATLGGLNSFANHTIDGLVDEVFIFDRALTGAELDQVFSDFSQKCGIEAEDTEPPVITLNGDNPMAVECAGLYEEPDATAIDDHDGEVDVVITGSVEPLQTGEVIITYFAEDSAGNWDQVERTVNVEDTQPPVITASFEPVEDDDSDDSSDDGDSCEGEFIVHFSADDACVSVEELTATLNDMPIEDGAFVKLHVHHKTTTKVNGEGRIDMKAPSFSLVVTATDDNGLEGSVTVDPFAGMTCEVGGKEDDGSEDDDKGHGNDDDGVDDDNPGNSDGKKGKK